MIVSSQYSGPSAFRQAILRKDSKAALRFSEGDFSVIEGEHSNLNDAIYNQLDPALIRKMLDQSNVETLNFTDRVGWNAIHWAAFRANTEVVRWLCEARADVNRPNDFDATALEIAVLLVEDGAAQEEQLNTLRPRILATVKILVEHGAQSMDGGQSPLLEKYLESGRDKYGLIPGLITILVAANSPLPPAPRAQALDARTSFFGEDDLIADAIEQGLVVLRSDRKEAAEALEPLLPVPIATLIGDYIHEEPTREGHV